MFDFHTLYITQPDDPDETSPSQDPEVDNLNHW